MILTTTLLDYHAACENNAVFDLSLRSKVELHGRDRTTFLHNFCTQDINRLQAGEGCEALVLNAQARVLARVLIFALPESLWLDSEPGFSQKIIQHLDRYLITEDVQLADRTGDYAQRHLTGPGIGPVLGDVPGTMQDLQHTTMTIADIPCQVRRNDCLGQPGYDLLCSTAEAPLVWQELVHRGAKLAGLEAYEMLRVEAGTPAYGQDIDDTNLPQELGRDARALSFTKGCYLGQEPVVRIRDLGHVNRLLMGLKLEGELPARPGSRVLRDGQEIGKVTSSVFSPRLGTAIALAYLRRGHQAPGVAVQVDSDGRMIAAAVNRLPFLASPEPTS